jgi:hypothetical protein
MTMLIILIYQRIYVFLQRSMFLTFILIRIIVLEIDSTIESG